MFVFLVIALLRHNSHINSIISSVYFHGLVYLKYCIAITAVNFRTFLSSQKEDLYPLPIISQPVHPHQPWTNIYLLHISIDLPILGISYKWNIRYLILCDAFISLSIKLLRFIHASLLVLYCFLLPNDIHFYGCSKLIYPFIGIWIASAFWLS